MLEGVFKVLALPNVSINKMRTAPRVEAICQCRESERTPHLIIG